MPKRYDRDKDRILENILEDENGCWIWQLGLDNYGYGMSRVNGKQDKAHRISYTVFVDEIPAGKSVLHMCDVRACVNYEHLYCGTQKDNMRDAKERGRLNLGPRKKPTEKQIEQMKAMKANGATKAEISAEFGIAQNVVQKYWKDSNNAK
jgi:DNA invertase Pin-like site-specific DNA recombinase